MIWYIPLERIEARYTKQMYNWVIKGFKEVGVEYGVIDGRELTRGIETGEVLDAEGTNYFKAVQLQKICKLFKKGAIKDGDIFFIADLWFPGIEMIRYIEAQKKMKVYIGGVHYAGVFDRNDFVYKMRWWARYNEVGWLKLADWVFVGSEYHKKLIVRNTGLKNIYATGLVWDVEGLGEYWDWSKGGIKEKERVVIFPHRVDKEKNPYGFFEVAEEVRKKDKSVRFVITTSRERLVSNIPGFRVPKWIEVKEGLSKAEYYRELARAKVFFSSAYQETFGYALQEALWFKCIPICPWRLSYPEVLEKDKRLLYRTKEEAVRKVLWALNSDKDGGELGLRKYTLKYSGNIKKMLEIMGVK